MCITCVSAWVCLYHACARFWRKPEGIVSPDLELQVVVSHLMYDQALIMTLPRVAPTAQLSPWERETDRDGTDLTGFGGRNGSGTKEHRVLTEERQA